MRTAATAAAALAWLLASTPLAKGNEHESRTIPVDPSQHHLTQQHPFCAEAERHHPLPRPRVAIIGGGAGGTSAAFFLKHLGDHDPALAVDVDLFEAEDHLGGRSTTIRPSYVERDDGTDQSQRFPAVELGGSIFVEANKNLMKAVSIFNLTLQDGHGGGDEEDGGGLSIWDGSRIVYKDSDALWGYWNIWKLIWRYGQSPLTVKNAVAETVSKFTRLYAPDFQKAGPFESIQSFAGALGLEQLAHSSTLEYLRSKGVSDLFTRELVAAATRVNYGQNPSEMQAFQGMVSMAASGASSVVGGNRRIFENFAKHSHAHVHLNTAVRSITRLDDEDTRHTGGRPWLLRHRSSESNVTTTVLYDAVILAAPLHPPAPSFVPQIAFHNFETPELVPKLDYVKLHVTLVLTNATEPSPAFFNIKEKVPKSVLATFEPYLAGTSKVRPRINSMSYLRNVGKLSNETGEAHIVKIFSEKQLAFSELVELFGAESSLLWWYKRAWAAYPVSPPFGSPEEETLPQFKPVANASFYYVSAFERWVSTMETETVSAWNAISLLARDLFGYRVEQSWAEWQ